MDSDHAGLAGLKDAPAFDRFATWPRGLARLACVLLALLIVLAAWAPGYVAPQPKPLASTHSGPHSAASGADVPQRAGDDADLRFYRTVIARVARGDDYYVAATEEQRRGGYPVAPALTVRLPTLALVSALAGPGGMIALQIALCAAMIVANGRRLAAEPGGARFRNVALVLMFLGISSGLGARYAVLHEVWAAQLVALSFGLHRPPQEPGASGKWGAAWLAAAAALAVRELALPFVMLMAAHAAWSRRWRECAGWAALIGLFAAGLAIHLHLAAAQVRPGDLHSQPWLVFAGLPGLLHKVIASTGLSLLPVWLGGPLVVLCFFGWSAWKTAMGSFATLLLCGYAVLFMIAGRDNNFYWGLLITPVLFMGLAFLPLALPALIRRARGTAHG